MKVKELRQKTNEELKKILGESRKRFLELKFNLAGGKVKNVKEIQGLKRDIARILTLLSEKRKAQN